MIRAWEPSPRADKKERARSGLNKDIADREGPPVLAQSICGVTFQVQINAIQRFSFHRRKRLLKRLLQPEYMQAQMPLSTILSPSSDDVGGA
jgi:hypothetical protein